MKQTTEFTQLIRRQEADRLPGYVQAQPRTERLQKTRPLILAAEDYLEQIQLIVRATLELGTTEFQVRRRNNSAMLLSNRRWRELLGQLLA